ncbi:two-component sensor histidine kinase [Verrucosispora sp. ts21]|uniref:sensor histidine kinase n=1 Tax=Verrucosispora sp. ts21 TaxID=2069341 RepID=UPI000C87E0B0|nr:sensor histidine kinase [Verrucosispora sp. ts21]PMR58693.1 two-component sensor histidine kinase [Verrucosispora sp. ts21]
MLRNRIGWRGYSFDVALATALVALGLMGTAPAGANQGVPVGPAAYPLVVVAALALALRRRWPSVTLAVVTGAVLSYLLLGNPYGPILVSLLAAVYTVAAYLPARDGVVDCVVALAALLIGIFMGLRAPGWSGLMPVAAWVVVPFAVGTVVRVGRENAARARRDEARRLADAERLRIAREVHDVVGHGLAAINMQAQIALHLLDRKPEQAAVALTAISRTSKEALDELRVTLTVVRGDDRHDREARHDRDTRDGRDRDGRDERDEPGEAGVERFPVPGLAQLPQLRDRLAGAGLPVTVETTGEPSTLPVAVDLAAYRVVQEALTNVLRHAGPATATVRIDHRPEGIVVEVTDTGRGPVPEGAGGHGYGLAGMRERVVALGGTFRTGAASGGGFQVYATLPVEESE